MRIPLIRTVFSDQTRAELAEFIRTSDRFSMGPECAAFEKEFAEYHGVEDAVLFNSGASANLAILQTLKNTGNLTQFNSVAFSCLTWATNVMPIIQMGFRPIPIDVDPNTLNVNLQLIDERYCSQRFEALFITNALGFAGPLKEIREWCEQKGVIFLEDNCESLGTEVEGGKTGTFGDMSSFSFFVAHHISTIEGGMVCCKKEYSDMLRMVRANGWDRPLPIESRERLRNENNISDFYAKYTFYDLGYNLRPTEITGFIGRRELKRLPEIVKIREMVYMKIYLELFDDSRFVKLNMHSIKKLSAFAIPFICNSEETRNELIDRFEKAKIETRPIISGDIQKQPFFKKWGNDFYPCCGAEYIHDCGFYIANNHDMNDDDIRYILDVING